MEDGSTLRLADRGPAGPRGGPQRVARSCSSSVERGRALRADGRRRAHHGARGRGPGRASGRSSSVADPGGAGARSTIEPGTQSGHVIAAEGGRRAAPARPGPRRPPTCTCVVDTPTGLSPKPEELLAQLAAERGEEVDEHRGRRRVLQDPVGLRLSGGRGRGIAVGRVGPGLRATTPPPPSSTRTTSTTCCGCCGSVAASWSSRPTGGVVGAAAGSPAPGSLLEPEAAGPASSARRPAGHRGVRAGQGGPPRVGGPEADRARGRPDRADRDRPLGRALGGGPGGPGRPTGSRRSPGRRPPRAVGAGCPRWPPTTLTALVAEAGAAAVALAERDGDPPSLRHPAAGGRPRGRMERGRALDRASRRSGSATRRCGPRRRRVAAGVVLERAAGRARRRAGAARVTGPTPGLVGWCGMEGRP